MFSLIFFTTTDDEGGFGGSRNNKKNKRRIPRKTTGRKEITAGENKENEPGRT
jgi:hypothetical protein